MGLPHLFVFVKNGFLCNSVLKIEFHKLTFFLLNMFLKFMNLFNMLSSFSFRVVPLSPVSLQFFVLFSQ
nr:hypothetical protein Iba_chr02aCG12650 [Ipomoea batatas]GMC68308.1 hypothetical protein Iba_chr02fCG10620 [Ipomoea batatas]